MNYFILFKVLPAILSILPVYGFGENLKIHYTIYINMIMKLEIPW